MENSINRKAKKLNKIQQQIADLNAQMQALSDERAMEIGKIALKFDLGIVDDKLLEQEFSLIAEKLKNPAPQPEAKPAQSVSQEESQIA